MSEKYQEKKVLGQLADILRAHGYTVKPPERKNLGAPAHTLGLSRRPFFRLRGLYHNGEENPRPPELTQRPFENISSNGGSSSTPEEGELLTIRQLARDFRAHPDLFRKTPGLGEKSFAEIEEELRAAGAF